MSFVEREKLVLDVALGAVISRRTGVEYQPVIIQQKESALYAALTCGCRTCVDRAKMLGAEFPKGLDVESAREELIERHMK